MSDDPLPYSETEDLAPQADAGPVTEDRAEAEPDSSPLPYPIVLSPADTYRLPVPVSGREVLNEPELERAADRIVLARHSPPGVVVNERLEILQVRGLIAPYVEIPPGTVTPLFMRMAREGIGPALRDHVRRAIAESGPVSVDGQTVRYGDEIIPFKAEILPVEGVRGPARAFLILFLPQTDSPVNHEPTSAYEELQSANEELQASSVLLHERDQLSGDMPQISGALDPTKHELRALAARLFNSQEDERRRVARELHDHVSQNLAMLEIETEQLRKNLPAAGDEMRRALENLRERMGALAKDVRDLSHGLHPSVLDDLGLSHALRSMVEEFAEREQMLATFSSRRLPESIPGEVAAALYRIAQEALRNVAKHAGRTHVKVTLQGTREGLRLVVRDSGEGFDANSYTTRGLGLVGMRERARLVGGDFELESELGEGTTIRVNVPLTRVQNGV